MFHASLSEFHNFTRFREIRLKAFYYGAFHKATERKVYLQLTGRPIILRVSQIFLVNSDILKSTWKAP